MPSHIPASISTDHDGHELRTFHEGITQEDLKWHQDAEGRIILPTHETDWKFQFDNSLPSEIRIDQFIQVPPEFWHRLVVGSGPLTVKIIRTQERL